LYRLNLHTLEHERFLALIAYEPVVYDGWLYFINGNSGFRLYALSLAHAHHVAPMRISDANSNNLRFGPDGTLFYRRLQDNRIVGVDRFGRSEFVSELAATSFDQYGEYLVIVEARTNEVVFYHLETGELYRTGEFAAYVHASNGVVYLLRDSKTMYSIPFPQAYVYDYEGEEYYYYEEEDYP
jgi:hypothetical protein